MSLAQDLDTIKNGHRDARHVVAAYLEREEREEVPIWLRPVSDQCKEDYDQFESHWRDPLFLMGHNKSQLWAPKSEANVSTFCV